MRIATHRFIVVFSMALTSALTLGALSQNVVAQEATSPDENQKQIALTDAQIESFIGAQKQMVPIVAKAPQGDQPDPKVMEELEADTKKYVGPDAVIKKHIAFIDSENLAANDKKGQLDELQSKLKALPEPVKFPAN